MLYNLFENRDFVSVFAVALLAEGVDRNKMAALTPIAARMSPSSRRAWIEITFVDFSCFGVLVALLAEGVDRNKIALTDEHNIMRSPSSRRAWIEIPQKAGEHVTIPVALLAEGVDRNHLVQCRA